jgi:hypothetical protein
MAAGNPIHMPAISGKGFHSLFARDHWQLRGHRDSNRYFYDPSGNAHQSRAFFRQRFPAANYCLFDVLQGFFHVVALGVAAGSARQLTM